MGCATALFFGPAPWGPWEGPKGQISLNIFKFQLQSQFQRFFKPNFVCLLTHERYKTYQTGFSFGRLGHTPGVGLRGTMGGLGVNYFFLKFNQIWCVSCLYEWHMHWHHFLGPPPPPPPPRPWGGAKRSNIIKSELQSRFQRFLNQTLCIFSQMKDIYYISQDFHSAAWVIPRGGTWGGTVGGWGSKFFFPKLNQIWCANYSHEWHMHPHNFLGPCPLGPWGGVKNLIF